MSYTQQEIRDMYKMGAKLATAHGWSFDVTRSSVYLSLSEGRGVRGKKVRVGRIGLRGEEMEVSPALTYDFLGKLLEITGIEQIAPLLEEYRAALEGAGMAEHKLPSLSWHGERGIDCLDFSRAAFKGQIPGVVSWESTEHDFTIRDLADRSGTTIGPSHHTNRRREAAKLYAALAALPEDVRAKLRLGDLRNLLESAGVVCHSYYANN